MAKKILKGGTLRTKSMPPKAVLFLFREGRVRRRRIAKFFIKPRPNARLNENSFGQVPFGTGGLEFCSTLFQDKVEN